MKAEAVEIDPDRAVAIGIIVNELVMNAVKYAYPDGAGPIHVTLERDGDDLELAIADDGVGLNVKTDPRSTGMGQRIVSAMAAKLEASVERDPAHHGTRIVLRFRRVPAAAPKWPTPRRTRLTARRRRLRSHAQWREERSPPRSRANGNADLLELPYRYAADEAELQKFLVTNYGQTVRLREIN